MKMIKNLANISKNLLIVFFAICIFHNLRGCLPTPPNVVSNPEVREVINAETADLTILEINISAIQNVYDKVIDMEINSYGGSVMDGRRIANRMQELRSMGYRFNCYVSKAFSMGFHILQNCDLRIGKEGAWLMQHRIHNGEGREAMKNMSIEEQRTLGFLGFELDRIEAKRMGLPLRLWQFLKKYSIWMNNQMGCAVGALDGYIENGEIVSCHQ